MAIRLLANSGTLLPAVTGFPLTRLVMHSHRRSGSTKYAGGRRHSEVNMESATSRDLGREYDIFAVDIIIVEEDAAGATSTTQEPFVRPRAHSRLV
jgi:hypothetical protein